MFDCTETRLQKSVKVFLGDVAAIKAWRDVGKGLGLSVQDLSDIGGPPSTDKSTAGGKSQPVDHQEVRDAADQMLRRWTETSGENASLEQLMNVAKKLKLNDLAGTTSCHSTRHIVVSTCIGQT